MMRRATLFGCLAVACHDTPSFQTIVVDVAANCNAVDVELTLANLDPRDGTSLRVLQTASDGPDETGWWLLVSAPDDTGEDTLQLWHLRDGVIDTSVLLGLPPDLAVALDLRPGPVAGEAWLLRRSPGLFHLWQVDASVEPPLVGVSGNLGGFPSSNLLCRDNEFGFATRCPTTDWHRDLVFLGDHGTPFLISVPPFSPDASTSIYLGDLVRGGGTSLFLVQERPLEFTAPCDATLPIADFATCEERLDEMSYPRIEVLAAQHDSRPAFTNLLLLRERAEYNVLSPYPDVVALSLRLTDNGIAGGILKTEQDGRVLPMVGPPSGLAIDHHATYLLYATIDRGPQLLRVPNLGPTFEVLEDVPLGPEVSLIQLDGDVALSRVVDGAWEVTKLFPDAPEQSTITEYTAETEVLSVDGAGPGSFMVHRADGGPDLLRVRCAEGD